MATYNDFVFYENPDGTFSYGKSPYTGSSAFEKTTKAARLEKMKKFFNNNWNTNGGIQFANIGPYANVANAIGQGMSAIGNISKLSRNTQDYNDLQGDVLRAYNSNPLARNFLNSEQLSTIRKLKRGNYKGNYKISNDVLSSIGSSLPNTIMNTLTGFAVGGTPGAVIGGFGSLINSGLKGASNTQNKNNAELEALYQALLDAEQQYNMMKSPNMTGLGIQQRYQQMYQ